MINPRKGKLLVDLDSIFDTRLAVLQDLMGSDYAAEVLHNKYDVRNNDNFVEGFALSYAARNNDTLHASMVTNMPPVISNIVYSCGKTQGIAVHYDIMAVVINTYPYTLSLNEKKALHTLINIEAEAELDISYVHIPLHIMTPAYILANYECVIMYNSGQWLSEYAPVLMANKMPAVDLFAPKLITGDACYADDIKNSEGELVIQDANKDIDFYSASEIGLITYIGLHHMDLSAFCVNMDKFKM